MKLIDEHGFYAVDYQLIGAETTTLTELKTRMLNDRVRYTGWGPFWFPTRHEIAPQVVSETTYGCVHDGTGTTETVEKWRATTDGNFTIIRPHDLDQIEPGRYVNLILPVWRIAEILLHAGRMGGAFNASGVDFTVTFTGLSDRELTTKETPDRLLFDTYRTRANSYEKAISLPVEDIDRQVVEYTDKLLRPFYELFQFVLPANLCEEEISRMRAYRF